MNDERLVRRGTVVDEAGKPIFIGPPFHIVGTNPNQIVWWNEQTGETQYWFMNDERLVRRGTVVDEAGKPIFIGPPFHIVGTNDEKASRIAEAILKEKSRRIIEDRWKSEGGPLSKVGLPRFGPTIEPNRVDGIYQADFRSGSIKLLGNGNIEIAPGDWVRVWWVGLECVIRQESEDEVYGTVFCHAPGRTTQVKVSTFPGGNNTLNMGEPGARVVQTSELLYEGPLVNLTLGAVLIENDSGDVEEISKEVADKISEAGAALLGGLTGVPADAVTDQTWYKSGIATAAKLVLDNVFGIGDDPYLPVSKFVPWQTLAEFKPPRSYQRPGEPQIISAFSDFLDASGVDDGGDRGQYRFYFLYEHANPPG
ncbi:hypothetical protein ACFYSW_27620, partial [Rhodococcus aetherivorans]|uniref:hypothetical protein n=1 Tax=Rhodococcus aetherivorans TaxID=191292 RepID=UPI0036933E38